MIEKKSAKRRPAPIGLTREKIVSTAIEMIEEDGLASLSARKLGARLGCEAMSLYNHVSNMDDLFDAIVDTLLATVIAGPSGTMKERAQAYLALAHRCPNAFLLVATRKWRTSNAIATAAIFIDDLRARGLSDGEALQRARALGAYLNGAGLALAAWRKDDAAEGTEGAAAVHADLDTGLAQLLAGLEKPAR